MSFTTLLSSFTDSTSPFINISAVASTFTSIATDNGCGTTPRCPHVVGKKTRLFSVVSWRWELTRSFSSNTVSLLFYQPKGSMWKNLDSTLILPCLCVTWPHQRLKPFAELWILWKLRYVFEFLLWRLVERKHLIYIGYKFNSSTSFLRRRSSIQLPLRVINCAFSENWWSVCQTITHYLWPLAISRFGFSVLASNDNNYAKTFTNMVLAMSEGDFVVHDQPTVSSLPVVGTTSPSVSDGTAAGNVYFPDEAI